MIKYRIVLALLVSFSYALGNSFSKFPIMYTYYIPEHVGAPRQFAIIQDSLGNLFLGNEKGTIIIFDGKEWEQINNKSIANVFAKDKYGNIYVGLRNDLGQIVRANNGSFKFVSFNEKLLTYEKVQGDVFQILPLEDVVYFVSKSRLYIYNIKDKAIKSLSFNNIEIRGITYSKGSGKVFVNLSHKYDKNGNIILKRGLFELKKDGKHYKVPNGKFLGNVDIIFTIPLSKWQMLIGTSDNKLWITDFTKFRLFDKQLQNKLKNITILNAEKIDKNHIILYTQSQGALIINIKTKKIIDKISTENGLPDNEIFSAYYDQYGGVWLSHNFGITYCLIGLPVENYGNIGGLSGAVTDFIFDKGKLYVTTTDGLFSLSTIAIGSSLTQTYTKKVVVEEEYSPQEERTFYSPRGKSSFGYRLPRIITHPTTQKEVVKTYTQQVSYKRKRFYFTRIKLPSYALKCHQIEKHNNELYVATIGGIFKIKGNRAVPVINKIYAKKIFFSKYNPNRLFVIQSEGKLISYINRGGKWRKESDLYKMNTDIFSFVEESRDRIWISGRGKAIRLVFYKGDFINRKPVVYGYSFNIDPNTKEVIHVFKLNNKLYAHDDFFFYIWNETSKSFIPIKDINKHLDNKYIVSMLPENENKIWIQTKENLFLASFKKKKIRIIKWGNLNAYAAMKIKSFGDKIFGIYSNQIIGYNKKFLLSEPNLPFKVYIKKLLIIDSLKEIHQKLTLSYDENTMKIKVSAPFYILPEKTKYIYRIKGLFRRWQESYSNTIELASVREGDYVLEIKAINILGQETKLKRFEFVITPPWYRTWWAYLIYLILLSALIYFIVQLYTKHLNEIIAKQTAEIREKQLLAEEQTQIALEQKKKAEEAKEKAEKLRKQAEEQKERLKFANIELENKNKELTKLNNELNNALKTIQEQKKIIESTGKMAEMGKFLAKVAHELNTPMGASLSLLEDVRINIENAIKFLDFISKRIQKEKEKEFYELLNKLMNIKLVVLSTSEERKIKRKVLLQLMQLLDNPEPYSQYLETAAKSIIRTPDYEELINIIKSYKSIFPDDRSFIIFITFISYILSINYQLSRVREQLQSMSKIVKDIKLYAHRDDDLPEPELVNISKNIKEAILLHRDHINRGITLQTEIEDNLMIYGYPDQLISVWSNIIYNAIQALGASGTIKIRAYSTKTSVVVEIEDNGPGIPEEVQDKIFNAFFTTKPRGEGTGLGLSIVKDIIETHDGKISFESKPGKTVFRIELPKESKLTLLLK